MRGISSDLNKLKRIFSLLMCTLDNPQSFTIQQLNAYGYSTYDNASPATVKKRRQRDIASLKQLGVHISWDDTQQPGRYRVNSQLFMNPIPLSSTDEQMLQSAIDQIAHLPIHERAHAHTGFLRILHMHDKQRKNSASHLSNAYQQPDDITDTFNSCVTTISEQHRNIIDYAMQHHLIVSVIYDGGTRKGNARNILPHRYFLREDIAYLSCYDYACQENRSYRLDRIKEVRISTMQAEEQIISQAPAEHELNTLPFQLSGDLHPYTVIFWPARVEELHTNVCAPQEMYNVSLLIDERPVDGVAWNTHASSLEQLFSWLLEKVTDVCFTLFQKNTQISCPQPLISYKALLKQALCHSESATADRSHRPASIPPILAHHQTRGIDVDMATPITTKQRGKTRSERTLQTVVKLLSVLGLSRYTPIYESLATEAERQFNCENALHNIVDELNSSGVDATPETLVLAWTLLQEFVASPSSKYADDPLFQADQHILEQLASLRLNPQEAVAVMHAFAQAQPGHLSPLLTRLKEHAFSYESRRYVPSDVTEHLSFSNVEQRIQLVSEAYHTHALISCDYTTQYHHTSNRRLYVATLPYVHNGIHYVKAWDEHGKTHKTYRLADMHNISLNRLAAQMMPYISTGNHQGQFHELIDAHKPEVMSVPFVIDSHIAHTLHHKVHTFMPVSRLTTLTEYLLAQTSHHLSHDPMVVEIPWNTHSAWLPQYSARMMFKMVGCHPDFLEQTIFEVDELIEQQATKVQICDTCSISSAISQPHVDS